MSSSPSLVSLPLSVVKMPSVTPAASARRHSGEAAKPMTCMQRRAGARSESADAAQALRRRRTERTPEGQRGRNARRSWQRGPARDHCRCPAKDSLTLRLLQRLPIVRASPPRSRSDLASCFIASQRDVHRVSTTPSRVGLTQGSTRCVTARAGLPTCVKCTRRPR